MPPAESERIISLLKSAIRLSNHTYRDVERRLGWRVGTVTRLMRGGLGLKIEHLLAILGVIGFSPGRFFAAACPVAAPAGPAEDRLYRMLGQMYGEDQVPARQPQARPGATSQNEIDDMVRESLRKLIGLPGSAAGDPDLEPKL
ncbi:MAG TPA: hypothetical protein VKY89_13395 [Thermoanaerobaculia bacterium]|jgi:hypothetical protein|nr:hypothetical protein [Thermoanaerobaculia bacterium]